MTGMTKALLAASITLVMAGCTSVQVQPLERMSYLDTVCIERNEAVIVLASVLTRSTPSKRMTDTATVRIVRSAGLIHCRRL